MIGARVLGGRDGLGHEPWAQTAMREPSGVLGRQLQFAARPLGWSDLDRLLELADGPAAGQISIPEPAYGDTLVPVGVGTYIARPSYAEAMAGGPQHLTTRRQWRASCVRRS